MNLFSSCATNSYIYDYFTKIYKRHPEKKRFLFKYNCIFFVNSCSQPRDIGAFTRKYVERIDLHAGEYAVGFYLG